MRKSIGFYLSLMLIAGMLGLVLLLFGAGHKSVIQTITGEGKLIYPAKSAVIKIDGIESNDFAIFESADSFYFVNENLRPVGFDMLVIDKKKNDLALPNSGCRDVFFSDFLFLADCGYGGVFYSDKVKMEGFDTRLIITASSMTFVLPNHKNFIEPEHNVEILFKGE